MNGNNATFVKGVLWMIGINVALNILPPPLGMIAFVGFIGYAIYQLWKYTRY